MIDIYRQSNWYHENDAAEKVWTGNIYAQETPQGPNTRPSLKYTLASEEGDQMAIYTANVEKVLAHYTNKRVLIRGKLVDLSNEGFGLELWVGSIEIVKSD